MFSLYLSMVETDDERELVIKLFETYRQRMYNLAYQFPKYERDQYAARLSMKVHY